jgi:hypothetical protein
MNNKESSSGSNFFGGQAYFEGSNKDKPRNISDIATDVKNDVRSVLSLPYNVIVRAPVHAVTRVARTGLNAVFGVPWTVGHRGAKIMENIIDYPVRKKSEGSAPPALA